MPGTLHTTEYYAARRQITEKTIEVARYILEIYLQAHTFFLHLCRITSHLLTASRISPLLKAQCIEHATYERRNILYPSPLRLPLMPQRAMPQAATCLRQLAMQSMPTEKDYWKIISPKRLATVKGECPFYRSSQKARYAKGFMNMLNSLPYNKWGIAIANLIAGFGQRTYYRARKGERLLLPEEQQSVLNVFRHLDAGMATEFDSYAEGYLW